MIIKVLLIGGIALAALVALRGSGSAMNLALRRLAALAFVLLAGLAVALPDSVTWVAKRVGVAQGSNLVLYAFVVGSLFVAISLYQRIQRLEDRLVRLARRLALAEGDLAPRDDATPVTVATEIGDTTGSAA